MRRVLAPLLMLLVTTGRLDAQTPPSPVAATPATPTTAYTRLYVFGDSYSDIGAGYIDGNGPTAVAYLAWLMGLPVAPATAANASAKSLVFAVSGAGTGEGAGRQVKDTRLGYGMLNQIRDFAARVKAGEIAFDPERTLFFLAGGLNDGRRQTPETLANLRQQLVLLREAGARHFTLARLPTRIPQFAAVGQRLTPAYEQFVKEEAATGIDLWLNGWGSAFDAVMTQPAAHGIVDTTRACAGRAIFDQDATPVGDPATFYFYHEGHPSTAVHRVVGRMLFEEIARRAVELIADYAKANIGPVPGTLGVDPFYTKYSDALGIPVIASDKVPDAALLVARDIVNSMLAARPDLRQALIARGWRTGVIAEVEMTMDIPEYSKMKRPGAPKDEPVSQADRDYHANRSRGLGGNPTTGAEENLLGYPGTRYWGEHIFVHEFAHAIMGGGIRQVDPKMFTEIRAAYDAAMAAGK